ncbi:MAG: InlB B-repeat-containing protein [Coriobacteriia bacterium]|nr:InlB B-repeat-containing protein [Coriobacteriia bacterium]
MTAANATQTDHLATKAVSLVLTAALTCPATGATLAFADEPESSGPSSAQLQPCAAGTDLNAAWAAQANGVKTAFTISKGGVYELTADLTTSAPLVVNAAGQDVTLSFSGHTLTSTDASQPVAMRIQAANTVTIQGAGATLAFEGGTIGSVLESNAKKLVVKGLTVKGKPNRQNNTGSKFDAKGINVVTGEVQLDGCTVSIDLSDQQQTSSSATKSLKGSPSGVYLASGVTSAKLTNCNVTAITSPYVAQGPDQDATLGWAYGLYAATGKSVMVQGGSYTAQATRGIAVGLRARSMTVEGSKLSVAVNGGVRSEGFESTTAQGVTLNAPVELDFSGNADSKLATGLYSAEQSAFVLGPCFAGESVPVVVDPSTASANDAGLVAVSFADSVSSDKRASMAKQLVNPVSRATTLAVDGKQVVFRLSQENAAARILGGSSYSSLAAALSAAQPGQTVQLLADCPSASFARSGQASDQITLDLAGHTLGTLSHSSACTLNVVSSDKEGAAKIKGVDSTHDAAVYMSGTGVLSISGVDVQAKSASGPAVGVLLHGTGPVRLQDVDVRAQSSTGAVRGIHLDYTGGTLETQGGSVQAVTTSASLAAYGIQTTTDKSVARLSGTSVNVSSVSGDAAGVYGKGSFAFLPGADGKRPSVSVNTEKKASSAYGLRLTSAASAAQLQDCAVSVTSDAGASGNPYWCLSAGSGSQLYAADWTLQGATTLSSVNGTHVQLKTRALTVDSAYATALQQAAQPVVVQASGLQDGAFAQAESGVDLSPAKDMFVAAAGSAYEGWTPQTRTADGAAQLAWTHQDVAQVLVDGQPAASYASVADALAAAPAGSTVRLVQDARLLGSVKVEGITLDVAGHVLTVDAGSAASGGTAGTGAALAFAGAGTLTLRDSSADRAGSIQINVGVQGENDTSAATPYQGIAVTGGGTLLVDGCDLQVSYTGSSIASAEASVRAIAVVKGAVRVENGSTVEALSNRREEDGALATGYGATTVTALYAGAKATGDALLVSADSQVRALSNATTLVRGSVVFPESAPTNSYSLSQSTLRQIFPEPGSSLYERIQQKFRQVAKFDSSLESATAVVYDAQVYYATEMVLDTGEIIWAYSDPVSNADAGSPDAIVAKHIFVQSEYTAVPTAQAVTAASDFAGNAHIAGTVTGQSTHGNAYAVKADGTGTWTISGACLSASAATTTEQVKTKKLDLRDYLQFPSDQEDQICYPKTSGLQVVADQPCVAGALTAAPTVNLVKEGQPVVENQGGATVAPEEQLPEEGDQSPEPQTHAVTFFANEKKVARMGKVADSTLLASLEGLPTAATAAKSPEFMRSYQLLGWSTDKDATSLDPAATDRVDLLVDENGAIVAGNLAVDRDLTFYAVYRVVGQDVALTFSGMRDQNGKVTADQTVYVEYGRKATQAHDAQGQAVQLPVPQDFTDAQGMRHVFTGWNAGGSTPLDVQSLEELDVDSRLAGVITGQVKLTPSYVEVADDERLVTFKVDNTVCSYAVKVGQRPDYADAVKGTGRAVPTKASTETGYAYSFRGWATGWSIESLWNPDANVFVGALPKIDQPGDPVVYTARFARQSVMESLRFSYWRQGANGVVYTASDKIPIAYGEDPTEHARKAVRIGDRVTKDGVHYTFKGWSTRKSDKEPLYADELPAIGAMDTMYYGIYEATEQKITVTFKSGTQTVGTAGDLSLGTTLDAAFKASGAQAPAAPSELKVFKGWSTSPTATSADRGGTTTVGAEYNKTGSNDQVTLYAVFGWAYEPEVVFHQEDGLVIVTHNVKPDQVLSQAGIVPDLTPKKGYYFAGWSEYDGTPFDLDRTVDNDVDLYATYKKLSSTVPSGSKAKADVTAAYLQRTDMASVQSAGFTLAKAKGAESVLTKRLAKDGYKAADVYQAWFGFQQQGKKVPVKNGFGIVKLKVPTSRANGTKVRLYWVRADGTAGASGTKTVEEGVVSLNFAEYTLGANGNLVVAYTTATDAPKKDDPSPNKKPGANNGSNNNSSNGSGSSSSGSSYRPTVRPSYQDDDAEDADDVDFDEEESDEPTDPDAAQEAGSGNGDQAGEDAAGEASEEKEDGTGNVMGFYGVVAAILAAAAGIAWWLVKRRRPDEEEEFAELEDGVTESINF